MTIEQAMRRIPLSGAGFFFLAAAICSTPAQEPRRLPQDTLAEIGPAVITARDLLERIELMPWEGKEKAKLHDSSKVRALQSMVAEQLLSLEATTKRLGTDTLTMLQRQSLEHLFVRDELYRREVISRVTVSPEEVKAGLRRYARQLKVLLLSVGSRTEGEALYQALKASPDADSTIGHYPRSLLRRCDTVTVNFGALDIPLEDVAYSLGPSHRIARPLESAYYGWVVTYLLEGITNSDYSRRTTDEQWRVVDKEVRHRKELAQASTYLGAILGRRTAEADSILFDSLASAAFGLLQGNPTAHRKKGGYGLSSQETDTLLARLRPFIGRGFVSMEGGAMTLGEMLEGMRLDPLISRDLDPERFRLRLSDGIKTIVQEEYMSREGYRQHLENAPQVRHDVGVWSNYWLSRMLARSITTSEKVSDEEVFSYLVKRGGVLGRRYEVNLREILVPNSPAALSVLEKLSLGADMALLARSVSVRPGWKEQGGESGYFRVSRYPELGFRALMEDTGKIAGPVHLKEGYCVFRVLGKREAARDSLVSFDSVRTWARSMLTTEKREEALDRHIAVLASEYHVKVFYDRLKNVEVMPANMFTRRLAGFGGVMSAVPMLFPEWKWTRLWKTEGEEVP